jgi:hypothetical protein
MTTTATLAPLPTDLVTRSLTASAPSNIDRWSRTLIQGGELPAWSDLTPAEQAAVRRQVRKAGGTVRAVKGAAHAEGIPAPVTPEPVAPVSVPTPQPLVPEAPADEPTPAQPADPAPIKVRLGSRVLTYVTDEVHWTAPEGIALAENAKTAHRYKDGSSVLVLTPAEARKLRWAAAEMVEHRKGMDLVAARGVLRWLTTAGVTA